MSGEESAGQIKLRAERLCVKTENLYLVSETDVARIIEYISAVKPELVIIDSIQTMHRDDISSAAGSVPQGSQPKAGWRRTVSANRVIIIGSGNSDSRLMDR